MERRVVEAARRVEEQAAWKELGQAGGAAAVDRQAEARRSARQGQAEEMIVHAVLFRPKADLPAPERRALVDALSTAIRAIPSVRQARVGRRVTHGRGYEQLMRSDFTYAAFIEFDDLDGLQA